jgi:ADP-ribose pyrophosphatase
LEFGFVKDAMPEPIDARVPKGGCVYFSSLRFEEMMRSMAKKKRASKTAGVKKTGKVTAKIEKLEKAKPLKTGKGKKAKGKPNDRAEVVSSKVVYQGPLFRVTQDHIVEPGGTDRTRDVIRHNGSVVVLALDDSKSKKDPYIVMERQYRHAANQFMWELPAGKLEPGEDALLGAQRELEEETGYRAKKWKPLLEYFASPGFLGETMKVFMAEGLIPGDAHPEEDEKIEMRLVKLSDILKLIEKGGIIDGKTLSSVLFYARTIQKKKSK